MKKYLDKKIVDLLKIFGIVTIIFSIVFYILTILLGGYTSINYQ